MFVVHALPGGFDVTDAEVTVKPVGIASVAELILLFPLSMFVIVIVYCWYVPARNVVGFIVALNLVCP